MITFTKGPGFDKTVVKILDIADDMVPVVFDELEDTAIRIKNHITRAMEKTPRGGAIYKRGGVTDRRSLPGKAPAPDSNDLRKSIKHTVRKTALEIEVGSNLKKQGKAKKAYSEYLEEGTTKMKARPFLEPAVASATKNMGNRIERALRRIR